MPSGIRDIIDAAFWQLYDDANPQRTRDMLKAATISAVKTSPTDSRLRVASNCPFLHIQARAGRFTLRFQHEGQSLPHAFVPFALFLGVRGQVAEVLLPPIQSTPQLMRALRRLDLPAGGRLLVQRDPAGALVLDFKTMNGRVHR